MLSTTLTVAELTGFFAASVTDLLESCDLPVCQTHLHPARPRQITCCPCSCSTRGGFTVTVWVDRVSFDRSARSKLRCPCITTVTFGLQIARCWPTVTKCESAAQTEALDAILAAVECIADAACCGSLVPATSPDQPPLCEAVTVADIVTLRDCDTDQWFEGQSESCCAGFETFITYR